MEDVTLEEQDKYLKQGVESLAANWEIWTEQWDDVEECVGHLFGSSVQMA